MTAPRVAITTSYLQPDDATHRLLTQAGCEVTYARPQDRRASGQSLTEALAGACAVIAGNDPFTADVLDSAPNLRIIARTGAGYDNVDIDAATRCGMVVCTTPGVNRQSVAELTIGLMMTCARGVIPAAAAVEAGEWTQTSGLELAGSTLGIVGLGAIGKEVAKVALAVGMRVVAHDPHVDTDFISSTGIEALGLPELLSVSDFVTLHIALTAQTHRLIDRAALARMKPGSFLINTARGGVVDQRALAEALRSGHLGGAALDVLEQEPLPAADELRDVPNLIITPHIGGATVQARVRSSRLAATQVIDFLAGRPVAHPVPALAADPA